MDDAGAVPRWFPGKTAPEDPPVRNPYTVETIIVEEDTDRCRAGVYLYWPTPTTSDADGTGGHEEMAGPVRFDGERLLEELRRQHPEADPLDTDALFTDINERMLTNRLIGAAGTLAEMSEKTPNHYTGIEHWSQKVEDAAAKRRDWRIAHGCVEKPIKWANRAGFV